jgi:hypothetical protein
MSDQSEETLTSPPTPKLTFGLQNALIKMQQQTHEKRSSITSLASPPPSFKPPQLTINPSADNTPSKFQSLLQSTANRSTPKPSLLSFTNNSKKLKLFTSSAATAPTLDVTRPYRILVVGDKQVGKSTFIHRYLHNEFMTALEPTNQIEISMKLLRLSENEEISRLWQNSHKNKHRMLTDDSKITYTTKPPKMRMIAIELWEIPFDLLTSRSKLVEDIFDDADAMILLCSALQ